MCRGTEDDMMAANNSGNMVTRLALIGATLGLGACDAVNDVINRNDDDNTYYYLSLGTSLSVGVQPNSNGVPLPTSDGYADQLYDSIRPDFEAAGDQQLELNKLGCPGETLDDMINGGNCLYFAGSQLDAAVDFLEDNGARVHLVTIDMGANDFRNANCITDAVDSDCVDTVSNQIATDLATALAALRNAASPSTTIVGMNYYNPYLASWLDGPDGEVLAAASVQAATVLNDAFRTTYVTANIPLADVYVAFASDDFMNTDPMGVPLSVTNICAFTYMCDTDVGPDIHANTAGYALIATTLEAELP